MILEDSRVSLTGRWIPTVLVGRSQYSVTGGASLTDTTHPNPVQTNYTPSWQRTQGVKLASSSSRSQSSWASTGCARTNSHPCWGPHGSFLAQTASSGSSVGLRSGESGGQVDTLSSSPLSSSHFWAVFAVLQTRCPAGGALPSRSAAAMRGYYLVCSCVWVTGVCQRDILMNARTRGFTACFFWTVAILELED